MVIFYQCKVEYELRLQIWSIDGRIIKDADHRKVPIHNYQIMSGSQVIMEPMSSLGHMNYIQNQYQDLADMI